MLQENIPIFINCVCHYDTHPGTLAQLKRLYIITSNTSQKISLSPFIYLRCYSTQHSTFQTIRFSLLKNILDTATTFKLESSRLYTFRFPTFYQFLLNTSSSHNTFKIDTKESQLLLGYISGQEFIRL